MNLSKYFRKDVAIHCPTFEEFKTLAQECSECFGFAENINSKILSDDGVKEFYNHHGKNTCLTLSNWPYLLYGSLEHFISKDYEILNNDGCDCKPTKGNTRKFEMKFEETL